MNRAIRDVAPDLRHRLLWIQALTVLWMIVEMGVALAAAWRAGSPALAAFGGDSGIELLSAGVVLWRFHRREVAEDAEQRAARIAGALLFLLAAYVLMDLATALAGHREPRSSLLGIGVLLAAALGMPWLAWEKKRLSAATASAALRADAAESAVCGYMAWIALTGLVANAVWGIAWADPVAALALVPFILREGWKSLHGKQSRC
jgi:divalent metal cation (Fe/Co/Zn/Cd) transporter